MSPYSRIVGRVLRMQRELRGVSLTDMARQLGYRSPSGWSRLETGDVAITVDVLARAARILGTTPGVIFALATAHEEHLRDVVPDPLTDHEENRR
jgi:transcriptional regulator with XRE-family HTH domain